MKRWMREQYGCTVGLKSPAHITLLPPLEVEEPGVRRLEEHLADVAGRTRPFRIHLRSTGSFRPVSPVVFVTVARGISNCEQLAHAVRRGPLGVELSFPYHPHVTIAHHLDDESLDQAFDELASLECEFVVDSFCLYVHDEDRGWQPSRYFGLAHATD